MSLVWCDMAWCGAVSAVCGMVFGVICIQRRIYTRRCGVSRSPFSLSLFLCHYVIPKIRDMIPFSTFLLTSTQTV